jgi:hypothetical protein
MCVCVVPLLCSSCRPVASLVCVLFYESALLSSAEFQNVCSQPAPGGAEQVAVATLYRVELQLYGSVVCSTAVRSTGMAVGGSRQLVGCSAHMAVIRLVQQHS